MAKEYVWGSMQGNATLRDDIFRAFDAWIARDPQSTNWWYQQINTPQSFGEILLLMEDEVSPVAPDLGTRDDRHDPTCRDRRTPAPIPVQTASTGPTPQ
jgi:hypothetical protein